MKNAVAVFDGNSYRRIEEVRQGSGLVRGEHSGENKNVGTLNRYLFGIPNLLLSPDQDVGHAFEILESEGDLITLQVSRQDGTRYQFVVDKNRGYNVLSVQCIRDDGSVAYEIDYSLKQYGEGRWFADGFVQTRHGLGAGESRVEYRVQVESVEFRDRRIRKASLEGSC